MWLTGTFNVILKRLFTCIFWVNIFAKKSVVKWINWWKVSKTYLVRRVIQILMTPLPDITITSPSLFHERKNAGSDVRLCRHGRPVRSRRATGQSDWRSTQLATAPININHYALVISSPAKSIDEWDSWRSFGTVAQLLQQLKCDYTPNTAQKYDSKKRGIF